MRFVNHSLPTIDLCVEEVLLVFMWKKVHVGDGPQNFSRLVLAQINQLLLLQKTVYFDRHCSFGTIQLYSTIQYCETSRHSNADVLIYCE